jgi:hypothetical protein
LHALFAATFAAAPFVRIAAWFKVRRSRRV